MSIQAKLDEIKKRCDAATSGPWRAMHGDSYSAYPSVMRQNGPHFTLLDAAEPDGENAEADFRYPGADADADFIAHARTDVPALAQALEVAVKALNDNSPRWAERDCMCDPKRLGTRCHRCHCLVTNQQALDELNALLK